MQKSTAIIKTENGTAPAGTADIQKIAQHMARLSIAGLPRNYELFHEALFGHNAALARDIAALGTQPRQMQLDELGLKYRLVTHCGLAVEKTQTEAIEMLRTMSEQLADGVAQKKTFTRAVETVARSIVEEPNQSLVAFAAEMEFLNASITNLLIAEETLAGSMTQGVEKLNKLEKGAAAVQAAALTDRLTALPNRIAFANKLAELYESENGGTGTALVLAAVDDLSLLMNRYGRPSTDRLLTKLSDIFRKAIKKHDFVARIDGDVFAFLFGGVGSRDALAISERLQSSVADHVVFSTSDATDSGGLTISIGIALGADANVAGQLQAQAETALAAARQDRRQPIHLFNR